MYVMYWNSLTIHFDTYTHRAHMWDMALLNLYLRRNNFKHVYLHKEDCGLQEFEIGCNFSVSGKVKALRVLYKGIHLFLRCLGW